MFVYQKEAQTRVSRIGNSVHYNDYPYKYSNINCNDVNDNDNDYLYKIKMQIIHVLLCIIERD